MVEVLLATFRGEEYSATGEGDDGGAARNAALDELCESLPDGQPGETVDVELAGEGLCPPVQYGILRFDGEQWWLAVAK